MKLCIAAAACCISATATLAGARTDTLRMPCAAVKELVQRNGEVILGTGGGTFYRVVRDGSLCSARFVTEPAFVQSADLPDCPAGLRCEEMIE